jgi:hypothetical protein
MRILCWLGLHKWVTEVYEAQWVDRPGGAILNLTVCERCDTPLDNSKR